MIFDIVVLGNKEIEKSEEANEGHTSFILSPYLLRVLHTTYSSKVLRIPMTYTVFGQELPWQGTTTRLWYRIT